MEHMKSIRDRIYLKKILSLFKMAMIFFYMISISPSSHAGSLMLNKQKFSLEGKESWKKLGSTHFDIYHEPNVNLRAIERKLRKRATFEITKDRHDYMDSYEDKVAYRMDLLCRQTADILGMDLPEVRIKVLIFKTKSKLEKEYYKIFGEKNYPISFFIYRYNTIYTSEKTISDSVISHEIGHAIVDNYFVVRPPHEIKEILSRYVDKHLED